MKVLLITRDFPPYCDKVGRMIRVSELANHLFNRGVPTFVLASERVVPSDVGLVSPSVVARWIRPWIEYRNVSDWRHRMLCALAYFPYISLLRNRFIDPSHFDLSTYEQAAREIVEQEKISHVVISTPPHSLQLLVPLLKKVYGEALKVYSDFRDPWLQRQRYRGSRSYNDMVLRQEQNAVAAADGIFVATQGMCRSLEASIPVRGKLHVVENGFAEIGCREPDEQFRMKVEAAHAQGKVVVGFFGATGATARRDGRSLLHLLRALELDPKLAGRMAVICQGPFSGSRRIPSQLDVGIFPTVRNDVARANMGLCDVGLVSYDKPSDAGCVMGGKVYDYIASGLALWILAPANADMYAALVRNTGKPLLTDVFDGPAIREAAWRIVGEFDTGRLVERAFQDGEKHRYSRSFQFDKLLKLMGGNEEQV